MTVFMFVLIKILEILLMVRWTKRRKDREIGGWESRRGLGRECFAL